jgi:hypothetical protein
MGGPILRAVPDITVQLADLPDAARAFVEGDVDLLPASLDARGVDALVQLLIERRDGARLQRLAASKDKALAKPARRGLHLLKTRGVELPAAEREFRLRGPYAEADQPSMASLIDGRGERIVWFVRPSVDHGYDVFQAELSETRGLIGFTAGAVARKDWRTHMKRILDDGRLGVGEISPKHARWLIETAYQRTIAEGRVVPESFAQARLDLGVVEKPDHHPALDVAPPLPPDEARPRLGELHTLYEVAAWIPPRESLQKLDVEIGQIATSRLIVDEAQRRIQLEEAILREADRSLTPELRGVLADRLRETALLLHAHGKNEEARLATSAAAITLDASVPAERNPFVRRLYEKLIDAERVVETPPEAP